jgi:hypothetical protein
MNLGLSLSLGGMRAGGGEPVITLAAPTWSDNFNTYADGTRLVAGDPNTNTGLINANPGNLGWDAITSAAANNARFNPIIFQGLIQERTANSTGDFTAPGRYLIAPPGAASGNCYAQFSVRPTQVNNQFLSLSFLGTDQSSRVRLRVNTSTSGGGSTAIETVSGASNTNVNSAASFTAKPRMGGDNGQFRGWQTDETITALSVGGRAYIRRAPGFPLGPTTGVAYTPPAGTRFGFETLNGNTRTSWIDAARVGTAPLFITVDETHRYWVPKKRASASDPITLGVGDETFTGTYVGTIPSRMQWALFNMGTGAVIKDWALVPTADFTASGGTWSARLRAIPSGLNGRGAYAVGFRPVNANNETDPAWQCVSNREFYVTLNVGVIGQSNGVFLTSVVTGTAYPRVDGLTTYTKADPPSLVPGSYAPNPSFWGDTVSFGNGRCAYVLADYLANLYNLPVSFEVLAIPARGAAVLGPIDVSTGLPNPATDWSYIQTHHAFAGGAYEILYLSQGENEFVGGAGATDWAAQWAANLSAYRDPSMHGQPAGTTIPVLYTITGRFTGMGGGNDAGAQTVRSVQYSLEGSVSGCYLAHSYTGVEMVDTYHYVTTDGEGYNEVARRIRLTYDKVFNSGAYDGRGPIATSATRSGAVITVAFNLNGATSLTTRNGTDQTASGNASVLTSWQVSADNFATTLTINSAVQTGNTVVITLAADPGGPVKVRNHYGLNPDISSFPAGSYADGTFICMMPLVNPLTTT